MPTSNHSKQILIGHVRYINILTWAFQYKLLYLMVFSLYSSLFWELRDKRNLNKIHYFCPESLGAMSEYWYIERGQTQSHVCARYSFLKSSILFWSVGKTIDLLFLLFLIPLISYSLIRTVHLVPGKYILCKNNLYNHKNYNFLGCDWFKKVLFSTNSIVIGQFVIG